MGLPRAERPEGGAICCSRRVMDEWKESVKRQLIFLRTPWPRSHRSSGAYAPSNALHYVRRPRTRFTTYEDQPPPPIYVYGTKMCMAYLVPYTRNTAVKNSGTCSIYNGQSTACSICLVSSLILRIFVFRKNLFWATAVPPYERRAMSTHRRFFVSKDEGCRLIDVSHLRRG